MGLPKLGSRHSPSLPDGLSVGQVTSWLGRGGPGEKISSQACSVMQRTIQGWCGAPYRLIVDTPGDTGARSTVLVEVGWELRVSHSDGGPRVSELDSGHIRPWETWASKSSSSLCLVSLKALRRESSRGECCSRHVLLMTRARIVVRVSLMPCHGDHPVAVTTWIWSIWVGSILGGFRYGG